MPHDLKPALSDLGQTSIAAERLKEVVDEYQSFHAGGLTDRQANYARMINHYYDLVTDFYEFGWGQSFHFCPYQRGESFASAMARYEFYLAQTLGLKPDMRVLDAGCGIGGPMRAIARFSGATILGVNNNDYQIARGEKHNRAAGLSDQCSFLKADFMNLPLADESFDAVYAIESTCHAPDKVQVFREFHRVLKPGAQLAGYEWCLTPRYDEANREHVRIKKGIEEGTALPDIAREAEVVLAMREAGFEVLAARDIAATSDPETPWWFSLSDPWSLRGFYRTPTGRWLIGKLVRVLETVRIAPKGSTEVAHFLNQGARALIRGGRNGIFTPMFFFHARKPRQA